MISFKAPLFSGAFFLDILRIDDLNMKYLKL